MKKITRWTAGVSTAVVIVVPGAAFLGNQAGAAPAVAKSMARTHSDMHVQANHLTGRVLAKGTNQAKVLGAYSDGCNHNYGTALQCVPLRAPDNKPVTCSYLKQYGYFKHGLLMRGRDTLHLQKAGQTRVAKDGVLLTTC